ncbi:RNA polymerase factor sigma-54 [Magnetovibrio sp. PR-2]|uniref:RNA polymerase factor sigma-54 n=1 Tax=Magnetovibrio sp. PR-2 TaxID=3120356 RepID=UPI002FCE6752
MVLSPRLDLRQSQSLVMTPQLQQAIKLLQLTNIELTAYVEQELEQNPLLERAEPGQGEAGEVRDEGVNEVASDALPDNEVVQQQTADTAETLTRSSETGENIDGGQSMDTEVDNDWSSDTPGDAAIQPAPDAGGDSYTSSNSGGSTSYGEDLPGIEQTLADEESMREHLLGELGFLVVTPMDKLIGAHLIDMLDEAGYVQGSLDELCDRLGCEIEDVDAVLGVLQTVEPAGMFARDLAECLALQLKEQGRLDPIMQTFLDNLDLLAKRDLKGLMKVCSVDEEDIQDMVVEIRALDPRPGRAFNHDVAQPVIPDVLMRPGPDGGWIVELNTETLPRVLVNNTYYAEITKNTKSADDKRYIQDCLQTANWLVKSLHQRATTIMKVASELVRQQDGFFRHGVSALKPLVLRDIADVIEMHESTVSRVTSNKYIATPRGIFELKYFFTSSVGGSGGGDGHSSEAVRQRIKDLVDAEDPKKVLSDDKIVTLLKAEGMEVARRTVAKYRDSLGIPSSVQRRREKSSRL